MSWRRGKPINRKRWAKVRRSILERGGYRCRNCGKAGRLEVDHIQPLDKGSATYSASNLQALCRGCHIAKTRGENTKPLTPAKQGWQALIAERMNAEYSEERPGQDRSSEYIARV